MLPLISTLSILRCRTFILSFPHLSFLLSIFIQYLDHYLKFSFCLQKKLSVNLQQDTLTLHLKYFLPTFPSTFFHSNIPSTFHILSPTFYFFIFKVVNIHFLSCNHRSASCVFHRLSLIVVTQKQHLHYHYYVNIVQSYTKYDTKIVFPRILFLI